MTNPPSLSISFRITASEGYPAAHWLGFPLSRMMRLAASSTGKMAGMSDVVAGRIFLSEVAMERL